MRLDATGKQCPIPIIMAKKELDNNVQGLEIIVDGQTQIDNLARLGDSVGRPVTSEAFEGRFLVKFADGESEAAEGEAAEGEAATSKVNGASLAAKVNDKYAVFFNKASVGSGSDELGLSLAKMAIFTLSESDDVPAYILLMNGGVKLVTGIEPQIVDDLNTLISKGTKVLVCGTCLNYFGIKDELKVGQISNMYDILGAMQECGKVITL